MSWYALSWSDYGQRCSRCGHTLTGEADGVDGGAVVVILHDARAVRYLWCADCMRRRRERARRFGVDGTA